MAHLRRRAFLRVVLSAAALFLVARAAPAADRTLRIDTRDGPRTALVYAEPGRPRPTVIVLHGALIGAKNTVRWSHFREAAAAHGYSTVFPEGVGRLWNDGRAFRQGADDVAFITTLAARLVTDGVADPKRLYLAGVSNGGFMTLRVLCEAPDAFAGAGTVIAALGAEVGARCKPKRALPLVMVSGTADPLVPYRGGGVGFRGRNGVAWGAERTAALFAAANGCGRPRETQMPDGDSSETSITRIAWACRLSTPVVLYRVENGGHQSYGGRAAAQMLFGRTTARFSAPEAILDVFDAAARATR